MFIQVNPGFSDSYSKNSDKYLALLNPIKYFESLDESRILTLVGAANSCHSS
jgi:hypothetical protein